MAVEIIGIMLGIWAIVAMNPWKVSIFPEPTKVNELIVSGPYRWIRHPMYASILLICLSLAIDRMHRIDFMVFAILLINQLIKLTHEEKLLQAKFPAYTSYMQKSNALIPFLF
ncbi:MAG: methyltransferase [Salibacteraceae bacterium]